jgi:hypothetical protein
MVMPFCDLCKGFASSIGGAYIGEYYLHQPNFKTLQLSSKACELCHLIIKEFEKSGQTPSITEEAANGYPTTITFLGVDRNGVWKYYIDYLEKKKWEGLVGLRVCCGDESRNDDWHIQFGMYTDHGQLEAGPILEFTGNS